LDIFYSSGAFSPTDCLLSGTKRLTKHQTSEAVNKESMLYHFGDAGYYL
jgi:hypothetical protein